MADRGSRSLIAARPWWIRCHGGCISKMQNNWAFYVGPFSINWDHEFTPYIPSKGFGWLPQPRRTMRIWLDVPLHGRPFQRVLQIKFWRDDRYCECGVMREVCTNKRRHRERIARETLNA